MATRPQNWDNVSRLVAGALLLAVMVMGCLGRVVNADPIPSIAFDGSRYFAAVPVGLRIPDAALSPLGNATEVRTSPTDGTTVYGLAGVSPKAVVVMKKPRDENGALWIFYREGALPVPSVGFSGTPDTSAFRIDGMCQYATDPHAVGCP